MSNFFQVHGDLRFNTNIAKLKSTRDTQLKGLLKGMRELRKEFAQAMGEDFDFKEFGLELTLHPIYEYDVQFTYKNYRSWMEPKRINTSFVNMPGKSYKVPEPYGVVLLVGAWNAPFITILPYLASAIAAGNCVLIKPSELSPNCSKVIAKLVNSYLSPQTVRILEGGVEMIKNLLSLKFDLIIFTGSSEKGKKVMEAASQYLTPCILELGGKNPAIMDFDCNIDNSIRRMYQTRFSRAGQICVAPELVFIHESIKEKATERMKVILEKEFFPEGIKKCALNGKIVNEQQTKRIFELINGKHEGKIVTGGIVEISDRTVHPTIIDDPDSESRIMKEEIFGPVLLLKSFSKINEVIDFLSTRPKPLSTSYFGYSNQEKVITQTSSGMLCLNDCGVNTFGPYLGFGGVGDSGMGKMKGKNGFKACSHYKPVLKQYMLNFWPFTKRYPPLTQSKLKFIQSNISNGLFLNQMKFCIIVLFVLLAIIIITVVLYRKES